MQDIYQELINALKKKRLSRKELYQLKLRLCKENKIKAVPRDIQILLHASAQDAKKIGLLAKPVRTLSGVAPVALMSKPLKCPHGRCIYCPGGPKSFFGNVPQSYTGKEPATMRALRNHFDPYLQIFNRLEHYILIGHLPDKVELIIMGGTFPSYSFAYQESFVKYALKAMNDFSGLFFRKGELDFAKFKNFFELPGEIGSKQRASRMQAKALKLKNSRAAVLEQEQKRNEKAKVRCCGMTIETRPDFATLKHANQMLKLGCTRVEVGVQSVYDSALKKVERGHSVKDTIAAFRTLKDLGFKINAHYMLGLPDVSEKKDLQGLKELFRNPDFKPDMLKIYPCMVLHGTKLYGMWKKMKYVPLTTEQAAGMIIEFKKTAPEWVRIMRVQRDIPTNATEAGVGMTNLRQYIHALMRKKGIKCRCIRCREIREGAAGKIHLVVRDYNASKGREFFISAESNDSIIGFCRLRFPSQSLRKDIAEDSALVRELHVYGPAAQIGRKGIVQHKGIGRMLLSAAESIAKKNHRKKVVVISGIGAREYYKKFGYNLEGPYMVKLIA